MTDQLSDPVGQRVNYEQGFDMGAAVADGMLKQQADEIKRLKGALKTVRVWAQVAYQRYGPSYPEIEDEFGDIIGKCDEALNQ